MVVFNLDDRVEGLSAVSCFCVRTVCTVVFPSKGVVGNKYSDTVKA